MKGTALLSAFLLYFPISILLALWKHPEPHCLSTWHTAGLCGPPGHEAFLSPPFLWLQEAAFIQPPLVPRGTFKQLLIRGGKGCAIREKQSSETIMQPWGKALDTPISFVDTKNPSRWEMLMINDGMCPQSCRPQTSWNLKVDVSDFYLSHHIRRMSKNWSCHLWVITIKLLTIVFKLGHMFWGH